MRTILENSAEIEGSLAEVTEMCKEVIEWADSEKRTMLRMFVQTKLAECLFKLKEFPATLDILKSLSKEVKKLDDKQLLVAIFLLESRTHHALHHLPKSRVLHFFFLRFQY